MSCLQDGLASRSTFELIKTMEAVAAELALRAAPESGTVAMEWAEGLGRSIDLAEAGLAALVRRVDACGAHQQWGFPSAVAWLRSRLGMRHGRAAERVTLARQLPRLERTAKLLSSGELSAAFAFTICNAVPRLDDSDAVAAEEILLAMAQEGCTVQQVAKAADRITDLICERQGKAKAPQDSRRGFARSWLQRARSLDGGSWVKGWLTPEHTATFDAIVGPLAKPKAQGDDRDLAQRTADALLSVLTEGNKGAGVTVIIDLAAYTTATGDPGPFADTEPTTETGSATDPSTPTSTDTRITTRLNSAMSARSPSSTGSTGPDVPARPTASTTDASSVTRTGSAPGAPSATDGVPATGTHSTKGTDSAAGARSSTHGVPAIGTCSTRGTDSAAGAPSATQGVPATRTRSAEGTDSAAGAPSATYGVPATGTRSTKGTNSVAGARSSTNIDRAARTLDGSAISPEDARRIALNAGINALILGRNGLPLYLGRTVRFVTPAQRKALLAIYETCVVQGCPIPGYLCEIHHLDGGWKLGTRTDVDKLVPACGWHNRWFEDNPERITQTRDARGRIILTINRPRNGRRSSITTAPSDSPDGREQPKGP